MNIQFIHDCLLDIVESFDEETDTITAQSQDCIHEGEIFDVDLIETGPDTVNIQFGDGSVSFSVPTAYFVELGDY